MANIREYSNDQTLRPSDKPAQYAAQSAAGTSRTYQEIGQSLGSGIAAAGRPAQDAYQRFVVQGEISQGGVVGSGLVNTLTQQWNDLAKNANPNDASILQTFTDKSLEPALQRFVDGFKTPEGKQWAEQQAQRYRDHFSSVTSADVTSRAASAAVMNTRTATNNLTNAAAKDPTSIDFQLENSSQYWSATKGGLNLDAAKAAQLDAAQQDSETAIVAAGLKGFADRNPAQFLKDLDAGAFTKYDKYLDADAKIALRKYAEAAQNAKEVDARAAAAERARIERANVEAATVSVMTNFLDVKDDGTIHVKDGFASAALQVGLLPGAKDSDVTALFSAQRAIQSDERSRIARTSDPDTYQDFLNRAWLPDGDPNKLRMTDVYQARGASQLSNTDFAFFSSALSKKDPEVVKDRQAFDQWYNGMKGFIDKSNFFSQDTPEAKERAAQFARDKWQEYQAARAAGKDRNAALVNLGSNLAQYQIGSSTSLQSLTNRASGTSPSPLPPVVPKATVPLRNPGETVDAYLKRVGSAPAAAKPGAKGDRLEGADPHNLSDRFDWNN